ncbi:hypothetical protein ACW4TU_42965 [Streptomyces sp. QTS52]
MREAVTAVAVRNPVGRRDGGLAGVHPAVLSALVLCTPAEKARELGLAPLVHHRAGVVVGAGPVLMLTGAIPATEGVLRKTGADPKLLNPPGGAVALGHPVGASGAVLMTRTIHDTRERGLRYCQQTMCEGGGTANATLVELAF